MKIQIDLKIIFLFIFYLILRQVEMYCLFLIFITIHELAHTLVGIFFKFKPQSIEIRPFGLALNFYSFSEAKEYKKIITYLSGPISNFILAIVIYFCRIDNSLKVYSIYINLALGIFNLLPILPLDGGKILKEILKKKIGYKKAYEKMELVGKIILVLITLIYSVLILEVKNLGILCIIIYLWYLKNIEDKRARTIIRMYDILEKI